MNFEFSGTCFAANLHLERADKLNKNKIKTYLTSREKEMITWLKHGKSNWDIAGILNIKERTVKFHISNILKKLNAANRTHAVTIAIEEELIEKDQERI